jgi:hypothetical protein
MKKYSPHWALRIQPAGGRILRRLAKQPCPSRAVCFILNKIARQTLNSPENPIMICALDGLTAGIFPLDS